MFSPVLIDKKEKKMIGLDKKDSPAVTHPVSNRAGRCLTWEFGRERCPPEYSSVDSLSDF